MSPLNVTLHRRAWLAGAGAALCLRDAAWAAGAAGRPFDIDDYLKRESLIDIVFNLKGDVWAALIQRPLTARGFFTQSDTQVTPRCDVWLAKADDRFERVTHGPDWALTPVFSPSGARLAVPRVDRSGRVRLEVYNVKTRAKIWGSDLPQSLDVTAHLFPHQGRAACLCWRDDNRILIVVNGGAYRPRSLNGLDSSTRNAALSERAIEGDLSVRRWRSDDTATCGAGAQLVELNLTSSAHRVRATGDIRAVAFAPDHKRLAVVRAEGRPPLPAGRPMPAPLGETAGGYEDTRVELRLDLVSLEDGAVQGTNFRGVGGQPAAFAPLWSDDGKRLAVPHRTRYSDQPGDSAVWCRGADGNVRIEAAPSPLDAIVRAHAYVAESDEMLSGGLPVNRPTFGDARRPLGRSIGGRVERSGEKVLVLVGTRLTVWSQASPEVITVDMVEPDTLATGGGAVVFVSGHGGARKRYCVTAGGMTTQPEPTAARPLDMTFRHPAYVGLLGFEDAHDATRLIEWPSCRALPRTRYLCNQHVAEVREARPEVVSYSAVAGYARTGVLYWPTHPELQTKPPVVVYAYPQYAPDVRSRLGRVNSRSAWMIQALLAEGFAVFHAAFPIESAVEYNAPFRRVADEVLPALDALDRREDIKAGTYGFYGHSNGGYAALALGAQTDRFKAIVAAAPFPDSFDTDLSVTSEIQRLDCAPAIVQARRHYLEAPNVPYAYGADPISGVGRFTADSPLYNLANYKTPTLILYGENDVSLPAVEKMFLALQAAGVPTELDTYWGDSHVLSSPGNIRDATRRQVAWFKRWL